MTEIVCPSCPEERKAKRDEFARPIMETMKLWMETESVKCSEPSLSWRVHNLPLFLQIWN